MDGNGPNTELRLQTNGNDRLNIGKTITTSQ